MVGATAEWSLAGVANPAKVRTNNTRFVSSSELVANITISADADLALWDIAVMVTGGKKGVGTEMFEVTTATIIGNGIGGYVMGASEQVSVAGYGALSGAWLYDAISSNVVDLGAGQAWGIDGTGTTALGRDGNWQASVWNRGAGGSWTKQLLPNTQVRGNATSSDIAADGSLILGGWIEEQVRRNDFRNWPVVWRRTAGVWGPAQIYAVPGQSGAIYGVAGTGAAAGRLTLADGSVHAAVWDNSGSATVLDGVTAYAINPAGTIAVGERIGGAAYWYRTASGWTTTATPLPPVGTGCAGGRAIDINSAGVIVGRSCFGSSAHRATVWKLDLSGATPTLLAPPSALGGLGPGATNTVAVAITSTIPYVVAGFIDSGSNTTVRWFAP
jgi:hypothetical protein